MKYKYNELEEKIKAKLTDEFLETLTEVIRLDMTMDYTEACIILENIHGLAEKPIKVPDGEWDKEYDRPLPYTDESLSDYYST